MGDSPVSTNVAIFIIICLLLVVVRLIIFLAGKRHLLGASFYFGFVVSCVAGFLVFFEILFPELLREVLGGGGLVQEDKLGIWGPPTANMNWCESDYIITPYVAEFWNTLTSSMIIIWPCYGVWRHLVQRSVPKIEARFIVAFITLIVVGAGSMAFHATLWRAAQVLDELPMLWCNSAFAYICYCMEDKPNSASVKAGLLISLVTIIVTTIVVLSPESQGLFLLSYGLGVFYAIISTMRQRVKYGKSFSDSAVSSYFLGLICWILDRALCDVFQPLQLHAWWHIFAGLGTYTCIVSWLFTRYTVLQLQPEMKGILPTYYVSSNPKKS